MTRQKEKSPTQESAQQVGTRFQDEKLIDMLIETYHMLLDLKLKLNWAVDAVFRHVIIEPGRARFASDEHEELLKALYQLYIERYGYDPEIDGAVEESGNLRQ